MTEPKVVLKNVHFGYSREWGEGGRFDADVWINGVKCMKVIDEGNGGCYDYGYECTPQAKANIKLLEDYLKATPKYNYGEGIDMFMADVLNVQEKAKEYKKMEKLFNTAIVFGVPNTGRYVYLNYKRSLSEVPTMILQKKLDEVCQKYCKDGVKILNTNLDELGIDI